MKKKGFTLIELLVVIAIIAMLMAILMPALGRVRRLAQRLICGTNLKGLGTAVMVYANDNNDEYPIAGGRGQNEWATYGGQDDYWDTVDYDWSGPDTVTVSASLYLLVRDADVSPKQFVCQSSDQREFTGAEAQLHQGRRPDLTDLWDFGYDSNPDSPSNDEYPQRHVSYAYHYPYTGANDLRFPISSTSQAGMAVMADKNPWLDPGLTYDPAPDSTNYMNVVSLLGGSTVPSTPSGWNELQTFEVQVANSAPHMREGQNILFNDGSTRFERRSDVGVQNDNIYTFRTGATAAQWDDESRRRGAPDRREPGTSNAAVRSSDDSFLVNDTRGRN